MKNELIEKIKQIDSREDLSNFILLLLDDYNNNKESWENNSLPLFLEAMSAWVEDMDGYYQNNNMEFSEDQPWKTFADMLYAAKLYE